MLLDKTNSQDFWCEAIRQRREVRFWYPSSSTGQLVERVVRPLAYGRRRDGRHQMTVRCYQVGGQSGSGGGSEVPRTFATDLMDRPEYLDTTFEIPDTYTPNDTDLDVVCELSDTP